VIGLFTFYEKNIEIQKKIKAQVNTNFIRQKSCKWIGISNFDMPICAVANY
jgi:hypothetical protein